MVPGMWQPMPCPWWWASWGTDLFVDDFEGGLGSWTLYHPSHGRTWGVAGPHMAQADQGAHGMVLSSNDCDAACIVTMRDPISSAGALTVPFDLFIDDALSNTRGV